MNKKGAFELIPYERARILQRQQNDPYLVAHFYYGQGYHSEWKYDPIKKMYENRNGDMGGMSEPHHICETEKEMHYIMLTCIEPCCCPNFEMKRERINKLL